MDFFLKKATPLHIAAENEALEVGKILIDFKADVNAKRRHNYIFIIQI